MPFGVVTKGMETVIDKLYNGYGDQQGFNPEGVSQGKLQQQGNDYLRYSTADSGLTRCQSVSSGAIEIPPDV